MSRVKKMTFIACALVYNALLVVAIVLKLAHVLRAPWWWMIWAPATLVSIFGSAYLVFMVKVVDKED